MHALAVASSISQTAKTVLSLPQTTGADVPGQARQHDIPSRMLQQNKTATTGLASDVASMLDKLHVLQQEGLCFASRM